jgi:tRNA-Thr(GGU) m(6)t(6)A37 methyltransferase TsaA
VAQSTAQGRVEVDPAFAAGLKDLERCSHIWLLYWMHEARRDLIVQVPGHLGTPRGTFALRSPVRPNPIAMAAVKLVAIEGTVLIVEHVDCLDGTPLVDIKPYYASIDSRPDATKP